MYLYHFGLQELPFTLTPNTHFFYGLPSHNEALQVLQTTVQTGEGFIKVTGEVGTGKTLICRKLMNELPKAFVTAYIPNPYLTPEEIRWALATEIGVFEGSDPSPSHNEQLDQQQLTQLIHYRLMALSAKGKSVVLIIDEAQALPAETLEALRLFTNLETESRKLLQVVLFGQPELDERIASKALRQLRQRISFSYQLRTMNNQEVVAYIQHRMSRAAGEQPRPIFSTENCLLIAQASGGVPRLVNVLCHKALMLAYGQGLKQVTNENVLLAIKDTNDVTLPLWQRARYFSGQLTSLLVSSRMSIAMLMSVFVLVALLIAALVISKKSKVTTLNKIEINSHSGEVIHQVAWQRQERIDWEHNNKTEWRHFSSRSSSS